MVPVSPSGSRSTRNSEPSAPRFWSSATSPAVLLVSPVGVKTNERQFVPGRNARFSGRLNGVAPAALASPLALYGAVSPGSATWTWTQSALYTVRGVCRSFWSFAHTSQNSGVAFTAVFGVLVHGAVAPALPPWLPYVR